MADRLDEQEENSIVAADIVNAQLVLKRYDGSTVAYGEAVYDPHINSLDPVSGGTGENTILITGEHFTEDAVVEANQMEASMTYYLDETMIYAQFIADTIGEVEITVRQGEQESNSVMFTVLASPTLTSVTPNVVVRTDGPPDTTPIVFIGTGFTPTSEASGTPWGGSHITTYVSPTELHVGFNDVGAWGPGTLRVDDGALSSNTVAFEVTQPVEEDG